MTDDLLKRVKPWTSEEDGTLAETPIFRLNARRAASQQSSKAGRYVYLDTVDWVNVVALTDDDHVVMIEQYRHGLELVTLEIPGGMVDDGEDPDAAGLRELEEETGFCGHGHERIGVVSPNPAIQNNWCHTVLVHEAAATGAMNLDESEEIAVRLVPLAEVDGLIQRGVIHHTMVVAAFHHLLIWRRQMDTLFDTARKIATAAHEGQTDKAGKPYITHPLRVANACADPRARIVGVLHDAVEDTDVTLDQLRDAGFPAPIVEAVDAISQRDGEPREDYYGRVMANRLATLVKIADVTDNMDPTRITNPGPRDEARMQRYRKLLPRLQAAATAPPRT